MKKTKNIKWDEPLDEYEADLKKALETTELVNEPDFEETKKMFEEAAKRYRMLQTSRPVTTRVNQQDLIKLKAKAQRSGIPYQTLLSSLIHQFVEGKVVMSL